MRADEVDGVAAALGSRVRAVATLAGGFSHETCLLTLDDGQVVARLGGSDPAVEAAVMAVARCHVPVPQVWRVIPGAEIAEGARSVMICEYVAGTLLSHVLSGPGGDGRTGSNSGPGIGWTRTGPGPGDGWTGRGPVPGGGWMGTGRGLGEGWTTARVGAGGGSSVVRSGSVGGGESALYGLGVEVGRVVARIGRVTFDRPGFFTDSRLAVGVERPWSEQLPEVAAACMEGAPQARLDVVTRDAWVELCTRHAPALRAVDSHRRLVHADINPKNILVSRRSGGSIVDAVLDWEFSYAGCPYGDPANMARFPSDHPAPFRRGFRDAFAEGHPDDLPLAARWEHLGRVLDMFALSDLVTRPPGHPIADQAANVLRRWVAHGVPATV